MKIIKLISLAAIALVLSTSVNAAIISTDWQSTGDNLITQDTDNGLEWLDITVTANLSYNDVSLELRVDGNYEGWRYASVNEVSDFWDAFGGDSNHYDGWSVENNGLYGQVASFWGDIDNGRGYVLTGTRVPADPRFIVSSYMYDKSGAANSLTQDLFQLYSRAENPGGTYVLTGSALVREISSVPIPAAAWLFGSGLIGLIGVARRKKA